MKNLMVLLSFIVLFSCSKKTIKDNDPNSVIYTDENTHIGLEKEINDVTFIEIQQRAWLYTSKAKDLELISSIVFDDELRETSYWTALGKYYYDWRNNRVYLNPTVFIDLIKMKIEAHNLPDAQYKGLRAPYSNNSIHIIDINLAENENEREEGYFIYNMDNNEITTPLNDLSYYFCFYDGDRVASHGVVATSEYTVALENAWCYNMLTKDGKKYSGHNNENEYIINKINNEFKNTLFDNKYIMDLIITINNSFWNIITREGCSLYTTWEGTARGDKLDIQYENAKNLDERGRLGDPAVYFLYNLTKIFPENNIADELVIRTLYGAYGNSKDQSLTIDIFDDGFYVYTHEKLIVMNIKNKTVNYYNIKLNVGDRTDILRLSSDGSKCFFIRQGFRSDIGFEIYKL